MAHEEHDAAPSIARMAKLAHDRLGAMSDVQRARGLGDAMKGLAQINAGKGKRFHRAGWLVRATAVGALGFALWLGGSSLLQERPLTCVMRRGDMQAGGYFHAGGEGRGLLEFSDGTRVELMPGSRGRVATIEVHGARLMLDEGEAEVRVTPRPDARWSFDAGPFVVHVTGTEFRLAWDGGAGRLDVRLHKGAVSVSGPVAAQPIVLRPGQWLTVQLATHEVFVRDDDQGAPPALRAQPAATTPHEAPAPAPAAVPSVPPLLPHQRPERAAPSRNSDQAWGPARSEGDWQRIVDSATKRGLERSLAERSSEDLALLADAAHYLHRDGIAEQALLAQRRRFPGSTRARDAAFLLGRIVESRPGGARPALAWYERHLSEAPDGAYASEALGRKMMLLGRGMRGAAARPVAEEYLRRYPGGTYAPAARAYVEKP